MATVAPDKEKTMAESATIMAEEMQPETKKAFMSKKYSREDRIKKDEEELEQLLKQQKGDAEEAIEQEPQEAEPEGAEEKTFKKRYSDLRRHQQQQAEDFKKEIASLRQQLDSATKREMKLPKSDEELESWMSEFPDVAAIVESIAMKKAQEQSAALEERMKTIDEMQQSATKEKAEAELMRIHPDFGEIRDSDDFHEWAEQQPKWVQDALYENDNDARSAARAIDLYKADRNISKASKTKNDKSAASEVSAKATRTKVDATDSSKKILESAVQKMSAKEYEKKADVIMEAIRSGNFVYDLSGSAR